MQRPLMLVVCLGLTAACKGNDKSGEGNGPERDSRFISDVYTWECQGYDTGGTTLTTWQGTFGQHMYLQYAPDALGSLSAPSAGSCSKGLDMFPGGSGSGGKDISGLSGNPRWSTDDSSGEMEHKGDGYWVDEVSGNVHSCAEVEDVLGSGASLTDAGDLSGSSTPAPGAVPEVEFEHPDGNEATIEWAEEVEASWGDHGWDQVWVQIRREREGDAWESVTCNVSDADSYTLSADMWALFDESINIETNNLYIAFQNSDEQTTSSGLKVEVVTRAIAVAVVQE